MLCLLSKRKVDIEEVNEMRGLARNVQVTGAILLVAGYMQDVFITLQAMSIKRSSSSGLWQVNVEPGTVARHWSLIAIATILLGMLAFIVGYFGKKWRRRPPRETRRSRLTTRDMLVAFGWVGLLFFGGLLCYYLGLLRWLPEWFRKSPGASALGGVSMQLAAMIVIPYYYRKGRHEIGLHRPILTWKMIGYVVMFFIMMYAMSLLTNSLGHWVGVDTNSYREQHISSELHGAMTGGWLLKLMPFLATSVAAPFGEEFIFRGVLQSTLVARYGSFLGVLSSAFLFALIHADLVLFLPIFLMGILFGVLRQITNSLWAPIWLHALNNFYASLLDLIF
jgi:membrane protease YdiL (CAAX protease family)